MSCLNITFIFIKILVIISLTKALAKEPDQVIVAKVNNYTITAQDVLNARSRLPKKIKEKPLSEIYLGIVNELINQHLITKQAYNEKLDLKKEIVELVKKNKEQIMAEYWLRNFLTSQTKEKKIIDFYNKYLKNFKTYKEYNASHILVKEEQKALQIIKKLKNMSEFSKLAKTYSIGPSKQNGGNLGWFGPGQMIKEFENATTKLQKGMITQKPIRTKFGYHIILLNDVRDSKPKKLNVIRPKIVDKIKQVSLYNLQKELRNQHEIKIFDFEKVVNEVNN